MKESDIQNVLNRDQLSPNTKVRCLGRMSPSLYFSLTPLAALVHSLLPLVFILLLGEEP